MNKIKSIPDCSLFEWGKIIFFLFGTVVMFLTPFLISKRERTEDFKKAKLIELEDNSFVPSYIGYFFISISVDKYLLIIFFYAIILLFMYFARVEYFNPIFLFLGYHIYKVESDNGVQFILILKYENGVVRESSLLSDLKLYRINNLTYIGRKK